MTLAELGWNDDFRAKYAEWVSKTDVRPDVEALAPFYRELITEYFPSELAW